MGCGDKHHHFVHAALQRDMFAGLLHRGYVLFYVSQKCWRGGTVSSRPLRRRHGSASSRKILAGGKGGESHKAFVLEGPEAGSIPCVKHTVRTLSVREAEERW